MNSTIIIYLYWIFFSSIILFYRRIKKYSFSVILLLISFFILLLSYQGLHSDWVSYREYYEKAIVVGKSYFEKGFDFLLFLSNKFGTFELVPIFTLLTFLYLLLEIYKEKLFGKNSFYILLFSLYCSFLPLYFGALRQAISSNFLYIAFVMFYKKKYIKSMILFILAFLFHKSAILILAIFFAFEIYCLLARKLSHRKFVFVTTFVVIGMFTVFKMTVEKLFFALDIAYRLGDTDNFTSNPLKDFFILTERIVLIYFSFILLKTSNATLKYFIRIYLGGSFFYCIFYSLARNLAGRTLAFYRYLDIYIMYEAFRIFIPKLLYISNKNRNFNNNDSINNVSLLFCIFYSLIKYYVTVASSGVF